MTADWDLYRHFLAVAQTGSLSAAAKRLGESQPTVGRRIDRFESQLGARLFQRSPRGFMLTAAGRSLLEIALRMDDEAQAGKRLLEGRDARLAGRVRVSASEGLGVAWLVPQLAALKAQLPALELELLIDNAPLDLLGGLADVALRLHRPGSPELVGRRVGTVGFGLYASRDYLKAYGAPRSLADLTHHRVVQPAGDLAAHPINAWFAEHSQVAEGSFACNSLLGQLAAMSAGLGVGLAACYVAAQTEGLVRVLPSLTRSADLWIVTHRDLRRTRRVRAVIDFLAGAARNDRADLAGLTAPRRRARGSLRRANTRPSESRL